MYSIIDIETTGNGYTGMKITEIAIFKFDGERVVDEYTTLINPECHIPQFITSLTGITNAMVQRAPKFYEVAKVLLEFTEDTIFVAHNVNFDYNGIQKEFKELGFEFKRKKLCTVRLSRKLIPNLSSYSLGPLCASQGIFITDRHRARGDAEATVKLFSQLLDLDTDNRVFTSFLNGRSRQATLPPMLPKEVFEKIPDTEGVYYFKNAIKEVIYVGKANNLKQRVLSHFYDKHKKELTMCMETADITYTETGSELLALLLESAEIKQRYPKYNRAQRRTTEAIALFTYEDAAGILHLAYNNSKLVPRPILKFYTVAECRSFLENLCETYELCPKYCQLQSAVGSCNHYQIKQCRGVCREKEDIANYNQRVQDAVSDLQFENQDFIIWEKGRTQTETAFVLVQGGVYKGFGYCPTQLIKAPATSLARFLTAQKDNRDIHRILNSYLKKFPENAISMTVPVEENLFSFMGVG